MRVSLALELAMVLTGQETLARFILTACLVAVGDTILTGEVLSMDLIYIPEGYTAILVAILATFAIIGPVVCAMYFKNESKGKAAPWTSRYAATMIIDMVLCPSITLIVLSFVVQQWIPDITPVAYLVILPIVELAVAYAVLHAMNEGVKATVEQIKRARGEIVDGVNELKK
jgi:hypothetical protein